MRVMMTIPDIINTIRDKNIRENCLRAFMKYEKLFSESSGSRSHKHHDYIGGLYDHTLLVSLIVITTIKNAPFEIRSLYNYDDVIIACIFHDFDKLNDKDTGDRVFAGFHEVIEFLDSHDLSTPRTRDGILRSHGGFSGFTDEYGSTSILLHYADMLATHVFKFADETVSMISRLSTMIDETPGNV